MGPHLSTQSGVITQIGMINRDVAMYQRRTISRQDGQCESGLQGCGMVEAAFERVRSQFQHGASPLIRTEKGKHLPVGEDGFPWGWNGLSI